MAILMFHIGCKKSKTKNSAEVTKPDNRVLVKTVKLEKEDFLYKHDFSGIIRPFERVDIGFKISGRIEKIYFDEGDSVIKGETLAVLEKYELEASYRQAEASYKKAKSSYERSEKLSKDGTISPSEIENYEAEYKIKKAAQDLSRMQLENATLLAPISGKLAFRNVEEKEVVLPNTPYFSIMNVSDVILEIGVPEYQVADFYEGQKAYAGLEAYPGEVFYGEIYKVAVAADDFNKLFKVEIEFPNAQGILKPGMIALVQVAINNFEDVYLIPLNAVMENDEGKFIYLERDDIAIRKFLKNYYTYSTNIIMTQSINNNDRLIIKGQYLLNDGVEVYEK